MARYLYLLFFLSGVSGLIYEAMWSRYLRLFVGSAATAQVLVLALFMGGMSLGAILAGRRSARIRRPVLVYGIIEGFIGLYAIAFPWLYHLLTRLCYDEIFPAMGSGAGVAVVKWSVAIALVLPPCVLLGMTFPLMSVGILRRAPHRSGEILSLLYFTNSFGAALGALLAGFVLVPHLGLPNTLLAGAVLNLVIFGVLLRERQVDAPLEHGVVADDSETPRPQTLPRALVLALLVTAFGTGMSSFMYEIGWIRVLSMILGSATHSFEVMLSAFVFGLALGGLWVRKRMDRFRNPIVTLAIVQLIMGIAAIATLPLYEVAVETMGAVFYREDRTTGMWFLFNVVRYLLCLLIMLPATFCAGMTLPLLTHVLLRHGQPESTVGRVYGVNTLGAIVGATSAGLILMPLIGVKNVIVLGALADVVLGILILYLCRARSIEKTPRTALGLSAVAAVLLAGGWFVIELDPHVMASSVFRRGQTRLPEDNVIKMHRDGRSASVTVTFHKPSKVWVIMTNGKPDASVLRNRWPEGRDKEKGPVITEDDPTQILLALIPAMVKPDARQCAMIGIGSGISSHVLLGSPKIERLTTIEIEPEMERGARMFRPANERLFSDPRSRIIFDDAKSHFAAGKDRYDIIISEPSNPWVSGVSSLFSVEFYGELKRYLAPGGVLAQWIHGYELSDKLLLSVLAAVDREFEDYQIYRVGSFDWVILASQQTIPGMHAAPLKDWPHMKEQAGFLGIDSIGQVHSLLVANKRLLHPYLATAVANSDEHPLLDTGAEKARFLGMDATILNDLRSLPLPLLEVFGGLERVPYPNQGIRDGREDYHVLVEPETALSAIRSFEPSEVSPAFPPMLQWRQLNESVQKDPAKWDKWGAESYALFVALSPWIDLRNNVWWQAVQKTIRDGDPPPHVATTIGLADGIVQRDAGTIGKHVNEILQGARSLFRPEYVVLAGALALEISKSSPQNRAAFANQVMVEQIKEAGAMALALRIIRERTLQAR